jgi:hypothetical protein
MAECSHKSLKRGGAAAQGGGGGGGSNKESGGVGEEDTADAYVGALPPTGTCTATSIHNKYSLKKGTRSLPNGGRM